MKKLPHIVFLNRCFPPEIGATGKILSQIVARLGKDFLITLLIGRPALRSEDRSPYRVLHRETWQGSCIERLGSTSFEHKSMRGRICNYFTYGCLALWRVFTIRPSPDVIVAMTDPPLLCVLGVLCAKFRGSHFVYSIQDLHPDMALASNIVQDRWWVKLWAFFHTWAMSKAELVTVLGEDMKERVLEKGISQNRVVVIRHGAESLDPPVSLDQHLKKEIRADFPFVVMYSGNIGFAGAWEAMLESARLLVGKGIRFVFIGEGTQKHKLLELSRGLSHIKFLPFQSPAVFPLVLQAGDLHVVTIKAGLEGLVVPSKVYPLLMAGCPILAISPKSSDIAQLINKHDFGFQADPQDILSINAAILYAKDHPQQLAEKGKKARIIGEKFSNEKMANEVSRVLDSVLNSPGCLERQNHD